MSHERRHACCYKQLPIMFNEESIPAKPGCQEIATVMALFDTQELYMFREEKTQVVTPRIHGCLLSVKRRRSCGPVSPEAAAATSLRGHTPAPPGDLT